jgi:hypothetical protein
MKEKRDDGARRKSGSDRLGKLLGTYSARVKGVVLLVLAALIALGGAWVVWKSPDISRFTYESTELQGAYAVIGWVLVGAALFCAALSPTYLLQSVEIRKKGVRHRHPFGTRELHWDDVDQIEINKVTVVDPGRGRRSSYRINFYSEDEGNIRLRAGFLAAVNAFALIQMLKMHGGGVPIDSDDDFGRTDFRDDGLEPPPRLRKRKRRREDENDRPSGDVALFKQARQRLARGEPADVVEEWLCEQGIARAAAAAMIDKIVATAVRREAAATEAAEREDPLIRQARAQLMAGTDSEKVKRWLQKQGVAANMAAAIVADLRQQML